jgi:ATP-dependent exoDNAse (exonuclease V) alpha subunit
MQTDLNLDVGNSGGVLRVGPRWDGYEAVAAAVLTPENRFMAAALAGRNCFLTGMAGTGKSTLLRRFIEECLHGRTIHRVDITAPTGVAALNVGGMTIHRFCGMMLGPQAGQSNEEYLAVLERDPRRSILAGFNRVRRCEALVIDEVSMLPGRQLEFVEFLFRRLRRRDEPFGGCQVIATGDFLQLPPDRCSEAEPYDWAFTSAAWQAAGFKTLVLDVVRRQDETEFVRALGDFRVGRVVGASARLLQERVKHYPPASMPRLFTHNVQVDKWNSFQLSELPGDEKVLEAEQSGPEHQREFLTKNLLTPATLRLKPGALVMFTVNKNEPERRDPLFVNGQVGVVEAVEGELVLVRTNGGDVIGVERFTWRYDAQDPAAATFAQFPLRLAWAMTIHKAQGLTLDSAYVDIRAAREPGQAYVAVSRVRTLAGLQFKEWPKGVHVSPEAIEFYRALAE